MGRGFSLYLQGVFQYLMNDVSWIRVGVVSWVEWVWLASFVESSVRVLS